MGDKSNGVSWLCSAVTFATGFAFEDFIRIVMLIIGLVSALISLAYNVYCWYNKAKKDGKITADEVKELKDIVDDTKDQINKFNKEDK